MLLVSFSTVFLSSYSMDSQLDFIYLCGHPKRKEDYKKIKQLLLNPSLDIHAEDAEGNSAIGHAIISNNIKLLKILLASTPHINDFQASRYLDIATARQLEWNINSLLAYGVSIPPQLRKNRYILEAQSHQQNLAQAVVSNDLSLLTSLLVKSVFNKCGEFPYYPNFVETFINRKRLELFTAIAQDDVNSVKTLLIQGLGLNTCDKQKNTLLHKSIAAKSNEVTKLLLYLLHKSDRVTSYLFKKNKAGIAPLDLDFANDQTVLKLLLEVTSKENETKIDE